MKKITLIHSYSDFNKGDLGIILGTINSLQSTGEELEINAVSTFNYNDPYYSTHHNILKTYINNLYPAIIGRLFSKRNSKIGQFCKLIIDFFRMFIIFFGPLYRFRRLFFNKQEQNTLNLLYNSDIIISKGGSFICNTSSLIDKIRLFRLMSILIISIRLKKKVVILGQSIGPVYGRISLFLVNYILKKTGVIVLREDDCIKKYPKIKFPTKVKIGFDLAFNLNTGNIDYTIKDKNLIGITVKRFDDKFTDYNYTRVIAKVIEYLIEKFNKQIVVIPHVTIDDDLVKADEIYNLIKEKFKKSVLIDRNNYSPLELLQKYSNLELLIGTRLHSTIFAMTVNTKVINIAYHGTKSLGVFKNFNMQGNVVSGSNLNFDLLKTKIEHVLTDNSISFSKKILLAKQYNNNIAKEVIKN